MFEASDNNSGDLSYTVLINQDFLLFIIIVWYSITSLKLQSRATGTSTWTDRWSISGQQQSAKSDPWTQVTVNLANYNIDKLRFKASTDGGYQGDIALDNINVSYANPGYLWTTDASNSTSGWSSETTVDINVSGSAGSTHAGTYTLQAIDDNGCSATDNVVITAAPDAGTLSGTEAVCSNGSTTFSSDGGAGTWSSATTVMATINSSTGAISPVAAGSSMMTYTVSGGTCLDASATRTVTVTAAPNAGTLSELRQYVWEVQPHLVLMETLEVGLVLLRVWLQ